MQIHLQEVPYLLRYHWLECVKFIMQNTVIVRNLYGKHA